MKCLVTGGAGYIGSHLVDKLLERGNEVTVLDNFFTGNFNNIIHHKKNKRFKLVIGCLLDKTLIQSLVKQSDIIFHLAAIVGVHYVINAPLKTIIVNFDGAKNIFRTAYDYNRRIVFTSTSELYGLNTKVPFSEESRFIFGETNVSRWSYSSSKYLAEQAGMAFYSRGLPITILRLSSCYGPRINPNGCGSVVAKFITTALRNEPITIYGDGEQTRPFTYIDDTVKGILLASESEKTSGNVYNIANLKAIKLSALATMIKDMTGSSSEIIFNSNPDEYGDRFEDIKYREINSSKALRTLNYSAEISIEEGLGKTISWFKKLKIR